MIVQGTTFTIFKQWIQTQFDEQTFAVFLLISIRLRSDIQKITNCKKEVDILHLMRRFSVGLSPCKTARSHNTLEVPSGWTEWKKARVWANEFCQCLIAFIGHAWHLLILDYDDALTAVFTRNLLAGVNIKRQIPPITLITLLPGLCPILE